MLFKIYATNIKTIFLVMILSILLNACSNVIMGFEKDSIFYTKEKETTIKTLKTQTTKIKNPTTFHYDPYEGE